MLLRHTSSLVYACRPWRSHGSSFWQDSSSSRPLMLAGCGGWQTEGALKESHEQTYDAIICPVRLCGPVSEGGTAMTSKSRRSSCSEVHVMWCKLRVGPHLASAVSVPRCSSPSTRKFPEKFPYALFPFSSISRHRMTTLSVTHED